MFYSLYSKRIHSSYSKIHLKQEDFHADILGKGQFGLVALHHGHQQMQSRQQVSTVDDLAAERALITHSSLLDRYILN